MSNLMEMISREKAKEIINDLKVTYYFRRGYESVPLEDALGRELAAPITSTKMSPEFDIATMDGYAIHTDHGYPFEINTRIYAGDENKTKLRPGQAAAIATGAFLPDGANAVLKMEDAAISGNMLSGPSIAPWTNVLKAGTDYKEGDVLFNKDQRIIPQSMALLYGLDVDKVTIYKKIKVGIISTGTEIFNGMIKNTNAMMITAFLKEWGCNPYMVGTVPDDYNMTSELIREATATHDVIITTGGVSVGERDHVHKVIKDIGEMVFHKVRIRPGKPLAVGIVNNTPVFALPGKPTGAFAALELIIRHYFTNIPRPTSTVTMNRDICLPKDGNSYLLFIKNDPGGFKTMGYEGSDLPLFSADDQYGVSLVSSSPRSSVVDGYVITDNDLKKGDIVTVNLFN